MLSNIALLLGITHEHAPNCPTDNCKICNKPFFICNDIPSSLKEILEYYNHPKPPITNFCKKCRNRIRRKHILRGDLYAR